MGSDGQWRWADPEGQQRLVREDELRAALAGGVIPPNAPVWKDGWREWQPAYAVPELTTSALSAANGVVPNIPPPPLGVLTAQKELEKEGAARSPTSSPRGLPGAEPPPPPRYVPAATRVSSVPAPVSSRSAVAAAAKRDSGKIPEPTPSQTLAEAPSDKVRAAAEESNTGVRLPPLDEARAAKLLEATDAAAPKGDLKTTVGVPALPQITPPPNSASAALAAALTPSAAPVAPVKTSVPPPLPPKASNRPPPITKKNTLIMYGGMPANLPTPDRPAPPINVPAPAGQSPQAITRPPPADGTARVGSSPGIDHAPPSSPEMSEPESVEPESIEELSQSMLVDESSSAALPLLDVKAVTAPPKRGAQTGTLLGFPVPTAPPADAPPASRRAGSAAELAPASTRGERASRADEPKLPTASSKILHDLSELMKRPRPAYFWPAVGVGGAVLFMGVVALVVGEVRAPEAAPAPTASNVPAGNASAAGAAPPATAAALPVPPSPTPLLPVAVGGPCALAGAARTIAPRALVRAGVEVEPGAAGTVGLGFAVGPTDGMAVEVEPASLNVAASTKVHAPDAIKRLVPDASLGHLAALAETDRRGDRVQGRRVVPGAPIDVGVADGNLVAAPHGKDELTKLWPVDGDGAIEALRGAPIELKGEKGIAIAFRRGSAVWMGTAFGEKALTARGPLFRIAGLGPVVGSPAIASVGESILIAWADRAAPTDPWGLRWVKLTPGEAPRDAVAFHPPAGGLGDAAMAPWIAPVGAGRFLFAWTEGPVSGHQVRAQTLGLEGAPIGDAFTASTEGTNAGQAQAAVLPDGRGVVAYLVPKGGQYADVVAAPITCPPAK